MVLYFTKLLLEGKSDIQKIWLAAHWQKKLKRNQITQIDIVSSVRDIMSQEIILDLRLSGHLLVGIVRIFSRKTQYLLYECNDIFNRVRIFRQTSTDLPPNKMQARIEDITIPETFDPNFGKINEEAVFEANQSRIEEITLKETFLNNRLLNDDFDEMEFEENQVMFEDDLQDIILFNESEKQPSRKVSEQSVSNFEGEPNFENGGIEMDDYCIGEGFSTGSDNSTTSHRRKTTQHISMSQDLIFIDERMFIVKENDKMELHLEPLSDSFRNAVRQRRKRKLIIDEAKTLDKEKMRKQYCDVSDIILPLDLAPPSKRLMLLKEIGEASRILLHPGQKMGNEEILRLFTRNLKVHKNEDLDMSSCEEDNNTFCSAIERNRGDLLLNEPSSSEEYPDVNGCDGTNFAEGMEGNEMQLSIESINPAVNAQSESLVQKEINFSNELQFDFSQSGNTSENTPVVFQDRIVSLLKTLRSCFQNRNLVKFSQLLINDKKRKVAQKFLSLLILKKFSIVDLHQEECYSEISIKQGTNFTPACNELCNQ